MTRLGRPARRAGRRRREPGLAARLFIAQALVIVAGATTLALVALAVAPGLFRAHVHGSLGTLPPDAERHLDEAFADAVLLALSLAVVVAALAALAVSWFVARRLTRPVVDFARAAGAIAAGRHDARVPPSRLGPEFAALDNAFNRMAATLQATEQTRRALLADLAHELRTPLATIGSYLEGLADGVVPADEEAWATLRAETARLGRLVDDVNKVSRAEEGRLDLQLGPVDPAALVRDGAQAVAAAYAARGVRLRWHPGPGGLTLRGDPDRLQEVLRNLLDNALRHTPEGGRVDVSVAPREDGVEICVADTGEGIDAEHLPRVFDRFYRADAARSRDRGGSGIGLTIARALVSAHGGRLRVDSAGPGSGARFTVTLPTAAAAAPRPDAYSAPAAGPPGSWR